MLCALVLEEINMKMDSIGARHHERLGLRPGNTKFLSLKNCLVVESI